MNLSSDFAGTTLKNHVSSISARWIMNYAAAIGENNPVYFDDERPQGIIAPPLFPVAATWPILENIADYIEADAFPREVLITQVHYTEHLVIHRFITPDINLTIRGCIAAVLPHRSGTHVILRFDAADQSGNLYFTEHIGAMMRGISCSDSGRGADRLPVVPRHETKAAPVWEAALPIDPLAPFIYDGCTNIYFPIHTSVKFAKAVGLPGIILQGTCTLAMAVHAVLNRETGGDPQRLSQVYCRFSGMVLPGSSIIVRLTGEGKSPSGRDLFFTVFDSAGKPAISDGYLKLTD